MAEGREDGADKIVPLRISLERMERRIKYADDLLAQRDTIQEAFAEIAGSDDIKDAADISDGTVEVAAIKGLETARDTAIDVKERLSNNPNDPELLKEFQTARASLEAAIAEVEGILGV